MPTTLQGKMKMAAIARVYVNGIEVGSMPVEKHKEVRSESKKVLRLYAYQFLNLSGIVLKMIFLSIRAVPLFLFFGIILSLYIDLGAVADFIGRIKEAQPTVIAQTIKDIVGYTLGVTNVSVSLAFAVIPSFRRQMGLIDYFKNFTEHRIKQILEVSDQGPVEVVYINE